MTYWGLSRPIGKIDTSNVFVSRYFSKNLATGRFFDGVDICWWSWHIYDGCIGPSSKQNGGDKYATQKVKQITSFSGTSDKSISFEKIS